MLFCCLFAGGCVNNYERFYTENPYFSAENKARVAFHSGDPEIVAGTSDVKADERRMNESGHAQIGYSSFSATGGTGEDLLVAHAKKVRAAKVIKYQQYQSTEQGVTALTLPDTQSTHHRGSISAYGSDGASAYGNYSGTSTTYGTTTTYIPYSRPRNEYLATFWVKMKSPVLGIRFRDPSTDEQTRAGTTRGAVIVAVVRGSPAHKADLVPGDLIHKTNEKEILG